MGRGRCFDTSKQWVVYIHEAPGGLPVAHLAEIQKMDNTVSYSPVRRSFA
jgi:hypothetical protein